MKKVILSAFMLTTLAGAAQAQVVYNWNTETGTRLASTNPDVINFDDVLIAKALVGPNSKINLNSVTVGIRRMGAATSVATSVEIYAAPMLGNLPNGASVGTPVLLGTVNLPLSTAAGFTTALVTVGTGGVPFNPGTNIVDLNGAMGGAPNFQAMMIGVRLSDVDATAPNGWRVVSGGTAGANFTDRFFTYNLATLATAAVGFAAPTPSAFYINVNGTFSDPVTSNPAGAGVANPNNINNGLTQPVNLRVTVSPGQLPVSTGLAVSVDASALGLSPAVALRDDGVAPDTVANDNVFNGTLIVPVQTVAAPYAMPFTITDTEGRIGTGTMALTITDAIGACCLDNGASCAELFRPDCLTAGGTFLGSGTTCTTIETYNALGSGAAFEDISTTGTAFVPDGGTFDDDFQTGVPVGFDYRMYGTLYNTVAVNTNGFLSFIAGSTSNANGTLPIAAAPNEAVYGLWFDIDATTQGNIKYQTLGTAGVDLRFIAQWTDVARWSATGNLGSHTFQIVLFEGGNAELRYGPITPAASEASYTAGIENNNGTLATSFSVVGLGSGNTSRTLLVSPAGPACTPAPACLADINGDGTVDGSDYTDFINSFGVGDAGIDPRADVNDDGIVDGGDYTAFINAFSAGC